MKLLLSLSLLISFQSFACSNTYPVNGPYVLNNSISKDKKISSKKINVVTFNIAIDLFLNRAIKKFTTNDKLKDADIILIQETTASIDDGKPKIEKLAKELKLNYLYFPAIIRNENHQYGNAILAKWPIQSFFKTLLPESEHENCNQRTSVTAKMTINGQEVTVSSIHLSTIFPKGALIQREDQLLAALRANIGNSIFIIGGDFNTHTDSEKYRVYKLAESFSLERIQNHRRTYIIPGWNLDHIFYRGVTPLEYQVINPSFSSDHHPLWASFQLP